MITEKLTEKEFKHLYELVSEAWFYKRSEKILTFDEQKKLYMKLRIIEIEQLNEV